MTASRTGARGGARPTGPDAGRRTERVLAAERRIGTVAHLLDDLVAVPGTRSRIGLDPIIGLVPFLGDAVTSLVAAWIVIEAARFRLPGVVLARMVINAVVDFVVGLVPLLGDLFDVAFKANTRNLELFHRHAVDPGAGTSGSTAFVVGVALVFVGVAWAAIVLLGRLLSVVI
jgi:hypothetical protein